MTKKEGRLLLGLGIISVVLAGFIYMRPRTCLNFARELTCMGGGTMVSETTCDACPEHRPEVYIVIAGVAAALVGAGGLLFHRLRR